MSPRRMLQIAGTAELVTLILMLANMLTVHAPAISQILGPLHGLAYMATVITAILVRGDRHIVWVLSLIPGIGGLLAARSASIGLVVTPLLTVVNAPLRPDQTADANTAFNICQRIAGSLGIGLIANLFTGHAATAGPVAALHLIAAVITVLAAVATGIAFLLPKRSGSLPAAGGLAQRPR